MAAGLEPLLKGGLVSWMVGCRAGDSQWDSLAESCLEEWHWAGRGQAGDPECKVQ